MLQSMKRKRAYRVRYCMSPMGCRFHNAFGSCTLSCLAVWRHRSS